MGKQGRRIFSRGILQLLKEFKLYDITSNLTHLDAELVDLIRVMPRQTGDPALFRQCSQLFDGHLAASRAFLDELRTAIPSVKTKTWSRFHFRSFLRGLFRAHWMLLDDIRTMNPAIQDKLKDWMAEMEETLADVTDESPLFQFFVCYAHADGAHVNAVLDALPEKIDELRINYWRDKNNILPADIWKNNIEEALDHVDFGLLFISESFFRSDFIRRKEVPAMLERREEEGMKVLPLNLVTPDWKTYKREHPWLAKTQGYPANSGLVDPNKGALDQKQLQQFPGHLKAVMDKITHQKASDA